MLGDLTGLPFVAEADEVADRDTAVKNLAANETDVAIA
jgi:hypothetical protein